MDKLIAALEGAEGPDRALDFAILRIVDHTAACAGPRQTDPHFTASIDAALTLVPEGAWWWVEAQPLVRGKYLAGCADEQVATGATPALALCIAALKARASS